MRTLKLFSAILIIAAAFSSCTHDDTPIISAPGDVNPGIGESADTLLVQRFSTAPTFDGNIDDVWAEARPLINKATVTPAGDRIITLNKSSNGDTSLEPVDLMDPYTGESYNYSLRGGHDGENLYLLFEWDDDTDSQERESWFFNTDTDKWQQENKYANHKNDKFYEDKFGMMFPIGDPEGFAGGTCTVTCHTNLADPQPGHKVTRHFMKNEGELTDFWHWKRDRHALAEALDDGFVQWEDDFAFASANGRKNDDGISPYANNQTFEDALTGMKGPKYVIPNRDNYYWIAQSEIDGGTAKEVTAIALNGTITYDGGTIDPVLEYPAYSQGFGSKRIPSIIINPAGQGNDGRSEVRVKANHTGSGWQLEIMRKLNTGDPTDADFSTGQSIPFGLVIFNNAAIAHGQTNFLTMTIEN
jgi:Ethylbenzene dehydrogenase